MSQECSCSECRLADEAFELNACFDRIPYIPTDDEDFYPLGKIRG